MTRDHPRWSLVVLMLGFAAGLAVLTAAEWIAREWPRQSEALIQTVRRSLAEQPPDRAHDGELVFRFGLLNADGPVRDPDLGLEFAAVSVTRVVEVMDPPPPGSAASGVWRAVAEGDPDGPGGLASRTIVHPEPRMDRAPIALAPAGPARFPVAEVITPAGIIGRIAARFPGRHAEMGDDRWVLLTMEPGPARPGDVRIRHVGQRTGMLVSAVGRQRDGVLHPAGHPWSWIRQEAHPPRAFLSPVTDAPSERWQRLGWQVGVPIMLGALAIGAIGLWRRPERDAVILLGLPAMLGIQQGAVWMAEEQARIAWGAAILVPALALAIARILRRRGPGPSA